MQLHWNPWAFAYMVQALFGTALAIVIFRAAPGRLANRSLALFLLALTLGWSLDGFVDDPAFSYGWVRMYVVNNGVIIAAYLLFLSTLDSPLSRPLRAPWARRVLYASLIVLPVFFVATLDNFFGPLEPGAFGWSYTTAPGPWTKMWGYIIPAVTFYAFAVSLTTLFAAPKGSLARQRAKAYSIAFAFFDLYLGVTSVVFTLFAEQLFGTIDATRLPYAMQLFNTLGALVAFTAFYALIAYGILRTQLFDIDVKIKWTVRQGTVAAVFLAVVVVFSQIAQNVLGQQFGLIGGGLAAGVLAFSLAPVQRLADKLANRAMPNVGSSSEYFAFKKLQVYRAAIEAALQDGVVTEKERAVIDALRTELDVGAEDARAVEADVRRIYAARSAPATG